MASEPQTKTLNGFTRWMNLTTDDTDRIIELIGEGMPERDAVREVGTSWTQFKRLMRRDPELEERYRQAAEEGQDELRRSVRSVLYWHLTEAKEYKAARDMAIIYLPEWAALRNQRFEVGLTAETMEHQLKELFGDNLHNVTTEQLEKKLLELEAGDDVIDATNGSG